MKNTKTTTTTTTKEQTNKQTKPKQTSKGSVMLYFGCSRVHPQ
jgi:hypothetical protein